MHNQKINIAIILGIVGVVDALGLTSTAQAQTTLAQFTFENGGTNFTASGTFKYTADTFTGTGSAFSQIGGSQTTAALNGGNAPTATAAYNATGAPAQGAGDKTTGVRFVIPTTGTTSLGAFTFDFRPSNTASRYYVLQYTTDGTTFTDFTDTTKITGGTSATAIAANGGKAAILAGGVLDFGQTANNFFTGTSYDLSALVGVSNNANFAVQVVSTFDPTTLTGYLAATTTSTYGTAGTNRFDNVLLTAISGAAIPEPTTLALLAVGGVGLVTRLRRKK